MENMLKNKGYVLVTGASSGIGLEMAKIFASEGYNLLLLSKEVAHLQRVTAELSRDGIDVQYQAIDLRDLDAISDYYKGLREKGIRVHTLVNNAGQGLYGKFTDTELVEELDMIRLNIQAVIVLTKWIVRDMLENGGGRILNVSSIAGKIPGPYQSVYHGTKAFVYFFSEALREELKESSVSVTSLLPGPTNTNFFKRAGMEDSKIVQDQELDDPAMVARAGYKALMDGDSRIIPGIKNQAQVAFANISSDEKATERLGKMQEPKEPEKDDRHVNHQKKTEAEIDDAIDQSFPASDPPAY